MPPHKKMKYSDGSEDEVDQKNEKDKVEKEKFQKKFQVEKEKFQVEKEKFQLKKERFRVEGLGSEWRQHFRGLREFNTYALHNKILTDVIFEVGPDGVQFHAHRLILALASPVFEAMFYGGLAEKGGKVVIPDIAPDGFQCLLSYIYTEEIYFESENEAFKASTAADKYCVPVLKEECEKYIYKCELSVDNIWVLFENALFMDMTTIMERCLDFLTQHSNLALEVSSFLDTSAEAVEKILQLDSIDVGELSLLQNIVRWAEHKSSVSDNKIVVKDVLEPLLKHVRFGILTPGEFCSFLAEKNNLLSEGDALAILKHLVQPSSCPLPEWCCAKTWRLININPFCSVEFTGYHDLKSVSRDISPSRKKDKYRKYKAKSSSDSSSSDDSTSSSAFSVDCSSDSDSFV